MKKSLLVLFTSMLLALMFCCHFTADAATYGDLIYQVSNGEVTITDCNTNATSVTIPETIDGYPVTSIGNSAFYSCDSLTSVEIPDSVTSIGNSAFSYCRSLTSVVIPDSVTTIGNSAFSYCNSLESVTIGNSVTTIGYNAFYNCTSLESVYITDIAAWCDISFDNASANPLCYAKNLYLNGELVTDLVIPDGVTSIGDYAFYNCTSLESVVIPESVTSIGTDAIPVNTTVYCSKGSAAHTYAADNVILFICTDSGWTPEVMAFGSFSSGSMTWELYENFELYICGAGTMPTWSSATFVPWYDYLGKIKVAVLDGGITSVGPYAFSGSALKSIDFGDSVTSIGDSAFYNCDSLTSVCLPDSVTSIGNDAFSSCNSLESVTIGNGVTSIGNDAFSYCNSLESVTIGNGVTNIGYEAFYGCSALTSVIMGNSMERIDRSAFYDCKNITSVYITDISAWCNIIFVIDSFFDDVSSNPLFYGADLYLDGELVTDLVIPDDVAKISQGSFSGCDTITSVVIPDSVASIGSYAFFKCANLESAVGGNGVMRVNYAAFANCGKLANVVLGQAVEGIDTYAFAGCSDLTNITIPASVTSIGRDAFYGCRGFTFYGNTGTYAETYAASNGIEFVSLNTVPVTGISLTRAELIMDIGETETLGAVILPSNASSKTVVWASSNASVATVVNGKVTALSAGIAEISAITMDGDRKAICLVTVTNGGIAVKNSAAMPGKTARVNIDITENPGIAAIGLEISYNRDVMTLESFTNGLIFDGSCADGNPANYPFVYNAYCADANKTGNGKLLTLIFSVKEDAPLGDYDVTLSSVEAIDINERDVYLRSINGTVRIMDCPGDVTGDGNLNRKDLLRLAKYFAGWDVDIDEAIADVNGDGELSCQDLLHLAKYLSGWDVTLGR